MHIISSQKDKQGIKFKEGAINCCKEKKLLPLLKSGVTFHFFCFSGTLPLLVGPTPPKWTTQSFLNPKKVNRKIRRSKIQNAENVMFDKKDRQKTISRQKPKCCNTRFKSALRFTKVETLLSLFLIDTFSIIKKISSLRCLW